MNNAQTEVITTVVDALLQAESVLFITGAGVSAESGVPTYRGIGGLYNVGATDEGFAIVLSVGTTSVFPYIQAPLYMAQAAGKTTVEINPSQTDVSHMVDYRIQAPAAEALQAIWSEYVTRKNR